jgi:hypothetical protein
MVWTKLVTTLNVCGVLLAVPAGAAGLYTTYLANFSGEVTCRALRSSILSVLEKDVDATVKRALLRKDVVQFEHSCARGDPEAKALITAISDNDLAAKRDNKAESRPVLVLRPPMPFFYRQWLNKPGTVPVPSPRDSGGAIGA